MAALHNFDLFSPPVLPMNRWMKRSVDSTIYSVHASTIAGLLHTLLINALRLSSPSWDHGGKDNEPVALAVRAQRKLYIDTVSISQDF